MYILQSQVTFALWGLAVIAPLAMSVICFALAAFYLFAGVFRGRVAGGNNEKINGNSGKGGRRNAVAAMGAFMVVIIIAALSVAAIIIREQKYVHWR